MPKETVHVTELEMSILRCFFNDLYLTSEEMADILRVLANKLEK